MSVEASVALNGRFSGTLQPTGTQIAAFRTFDAIIRAPERQITLTIFADPAFPGVAEWKEQPRVTLVPVPFSRWSRGRAQLWEQLVFPKQCIRFGCRVAHHPINSSPTFKKRIKSIVTLHDLNFLLHPEWFARRLRAVCHLTVLPGLRRADRVIAISRYVQEQAAQHLRLPPDRLQSIYHGIALSSAIAPANPSSKPIYLLAVGSLQPHKNLSRLIDAFASLTREWPSLELWVVGRPQPRFRRDREALGKLATPGVKLLGYLSDGALQTVYRNAAVFCYPSLEEGFGLPVLEAMQAGVPVVTSACSCLPEIAGPAADLVDPFSVSQIANAISKALALNPAQRDARIQTGRDWAGRFSWPATAQAYLDNYAELLAA